MKTSAQLESFLESEFLDELVIFHLLGREVATYRIQAGVSKDDPLTEEEMSFIMDVFQRVMNTPRKYARQEHLPIVTIVMNGIARKFEGANEGFWT